MLPALIFAAALPTATAPAAERLRIVGKTTDGRTISLPDEGTGKPVVAVVGMTRNSSEQTARWSEALYAKLGAQDDVYGIALLDRVPGFARAFVTRAVAKAIGPPQTGHAGFLMAFDGTAVRRSAPAGKDDDPVIYVFDRDGKLVFSKRLGFADSAVDDVVRTVR